MQFRGGGKTLTTKIKIFGGIEKNLVVEKHNKVEVI